MLQTLATSQGNILENKDLIESLNQTKASSALTQESLKESHKLQISLDQVITSFFLVIIYHVFLNFYVNMIKQCRQGNDDYKKKKALQKPQSHGSDWSCRRGGWDAQGAEKDCRLLLTSGVTLPQVLKLKMRILKMTVKSICAIPGAF